MTNLVSDGVITAAQAANAQVRENVRAHLSATRQTPLLKRFFANIPKGSTLASIYTVLGRIDYPGSSMVGLPTAAKIIGRVDGTAVGAVRLFDATNLTVIAENSGIAAVADSLISLGAIANVPAGPAIFEIQALRVSGVGQDKVHVHSFSMEF